MWVLTAFGFFSIVQKPSDKKAGSLTVRARVRDDLVALKAALPSLGKISEDEGTDYKYRAMVSKNELAAAIADLILGLDYPNFKDAVAKRQGAKRAETYHGVWDVLYSLQDVAPSEDATPATSPKDAPHSTMSGDATVALKAEAYGGVLINERGEVLLREPSGHSGGHVWTFAKGQPDDGETEEVTALREVLEETGVYGNITAVIPKVFGGSTRSTVFYLMEPVGTPTQFSQETAAIRWVNEAAARGLIKLTTTKLGRERDLAVLEAAFHVWKASR